MSNLGDRVQQIIYSKMIDISLEKDYLLEDLMSNYKGRLNRLRTAYQSNVHYVFHDKSGDRTTTRTVGEYNDRESRLMIKAWQGVKQEYKI